MKIYNLVSMGLLTIGALGALYGNLSLVIYASAVMICHAIRGAGK